MSNLFAQNSSVNWNSANQWNTAANGSGSFQTPTTGDVCMANGKTAIAININVTVGEIRTDTTGGATTGGSFTLSNGVTLTANVIAGSTATTLTFAGNAGNTGTIVGNITGGTSASAVAVAVTGTGTLAVTGNVIGGTNTSCHGINVTGAATVTVSGTVSGGTGTANSARGIQIASVAATLTVGGLVSGGASTINCEGVSTTGSGVHTFNNGIAGTNNGVGVSSTGNGNTVVVTAGGVSAISNGLVVAGSNITVTVSGPVSSSGSGTAIGSTATGTSVISATGNASATSSGSAISTSSASPSTCAVVGNVTNSGSGIAVSNSGTGTVSITGNVTNGSASQHCASNSSTGTMNITGDVTGSTFSANIWGAVNQAAGALNVYGTAIGGGGATATNASGVNNTLAGTCYVQIAKSNDYPNGLIANGASGTTQAAGTAGITIDAMEFGSGGWPPIIGRHFVRDAGTNFVKMRQSNAGSVTTIGELANDYPSPANVRFGTVYNFTGQTGTAYIPGASSVAAGVNVDATVGTAVITVAALMAAALPSTPTANTLGEAMFIADNLVGRINTAAGGGASSITLDAGASSVDGRYVGYRAFLYGGTGGGVRGVGQERSITAYNGTTKIATVAQPWGTVPDATTTYMLYVEPWANVGSWNGTPVATPSTAGVPVVDLKYILGTLLTETAGQIAAGFKKFFNIAAPAATMDHGVLVDTVTTATTATTLTNDAGITQAGADKVWGSASRSLTTYGTLVADTTAAVWAAATRSLTDKVGFALSAAGAQAIWDALSSASTVVGSMGKRVVDFLTGDAYTRIGANGAGLTALGDTRIAHLDQNISAAQTLTAGERIAIAAAVEAAIMNESDGQQVLQAIVDKINSVDADLSGLSVAAIATAVWAAATRRLTDGTNIVLAKGVGLIGLNDETKAAIALAVRTELAVELARLDTNTGSRATQTSVDDIPTTTEFAAALAAADDATLAAVAGAQSDIDAIRDQTDQLTFTIPGQVDANAISGGTDAPGIRAAVGLNAADLDDQLAAGRERTDRIPDVPASQGAVTTAASAILAVLGTPEGASIAEDIASITGTTPEQIFDYLETLALGRRLKNVATVDTVGEQLEAML